MHLEGGQRKPTGRTALTLRSAPQVLHDMLSSPWLMMGSSTPAASSASPTSLHGSSPSSLVFSSFQLRCGGVAAELELSCSILSTCESDPRQNVLGVRKRGVAREVG